MKYPGGKQYIPKMDAIIEQKVNKYKNEKQLLDGKKFDSKKEAGRYAQLLLLEKAKKISDLQTQVPFILIEKSQHGRAIKYIADFVYNENGQIVVEDTKGAKTAVYRLKKRLMAEKYGIVIKET